MLKGMKEQMKDNEKLGGLQSQIKDMHGDYEEMKRVREEARKKLEERFQEIHKKIVVMSQSIETGAKEVNEKIKRFQIKFEKNLGDLKEHVFRDLEVEKVSTTKRFAENNDRMEHLEKLIKEEREERLRQTDEQLLPIRAHLEKLQGEFDVEKVIRVDNEKAIVKTLDLEAVGFNENLDEEKIERNKNVVKLKEDTIKEMNIRDDLFKEFQNKLNLRIVDMKDEIYLEMNNRFHHQTEIVDGITKFLKTFQDTLKVVGEDVVR